jgi:hypothetical protein
MFMNGIVLEFPKIYIAVVLPTVVKFEYNPHLLQQVLEFLKERLSTQALIAQFKQESHADLILIRVNTVLRKYSIIRREERAERKTFDIRVLFRADDDLVEKADIYARLLFESTMQVRISSPTDLHQITMGRHAGFGEEERLEALRVSRPKARFLQTRHRCDNQKTPSWQIYGIGKEAEKETTVMKDGKEKIK